MGSVMSTKAVPLVRPMRAYSLLVSGSVQPQISFAPEGADVPGELNVLRGKSESRSIFWQG